MKGKAESGFSFLSLESLLSLKSLSLSLFA